MGKYYYAVAKGRCTGIYNDWNSCKDNVSGYSGATYKKFDSKSAAEAFINENGNESQETGYGSVPSYNAPTYRSAPSYRYRSESETTDLYSRDSSSYRQNSYRTPRETNYKTSPSTFANRSENIDRIYVDGASRGNGKSKMPISGYGVYYGENDERNASVPLTDVDIVEEKTPTNQRAELHAVKHALTNIASDLKANTPIKSEIFTDSKYTINTYTNWAKEWEKNGWKNSQGKDVANQDIIKSTLPVLKYVNSEYNKRNWGDIKLNHVKGHSGDIGNENADKLANDGADKMARGVY